MLSAVYRYTITDRAIDLLNGGYLEHEVVSNLAIEFEMDEFQIEDLPKLVRNINLKRERSNASRTA
tara:strand:+ start:180 stop:377 length:198 start_codon:yes stop_codon:yes gene_type:complete